MIFEEFVEKLTDAYEHLYDLVHLRNHALIDALTQADSRKEQAWQLHKILLQTIEELDPGAAAPAFSREWRRHRLMVLRYVDGLTAQTVADQLAISRRHYYREHESAVGAVAQILWNRRIVIDAEIAPTITPSLSKTPLTNIGEILDGALTLLRDKLTQKNIEVRRSDTRLLVAVDGQLLRQLVLALLGYLTDRIENTSLSINLENSGETTLHFELEPIWMTERDSAAHDALQKLATLTHIRLDVLRDSENHLGGFIAHLSPAQPQPLVLIVDDNNDLIELYRRYLEAHQYQTVGARDGKEALELSHTMHPAAILLDLMMPDQDGWDVLQYLRNQPVLQHIPVIVCSILPQRDLALSLGADGFLQKPVSEETLIESLGTILNAPSVS